MKKLKIFFDIEQEEAWLNEQLQKGYRCIHVNNLNVYTFEQTNQRYIMRLDYQDYLLKAKFTEYNDLYEDYGWHCVKGSSIGGIKYWKKEDGRLNDIFSDNESKRHYYKRVMNYTLGFAILSALFFYFIMNNGGLYMTKGLWDMERSLFWSAFLFETPFALLRLLPLLIAGFFGASFYKAYRKHKFLKEH